VFHLAAKVSVPASVEDPAGYHQVDATGTVRVLEAARRAGVRRVVYSASSSAYGDTPTLPKHEQMPPTPQSPYAAAKLAGEAYCRAHASVYDLDAVSLRYFNIFGPRQNANSAYAGVIAAFARDLLAGKRPTIFGDGSASRDFTFVANVVQANLLAARHEKPLGGDVLNVGVGRRITINELAEQMAKMLDRSDLAAEHAAERPGDVAHSLADLSHTRNVLGYEPIVDFEDGLRQTVEWYRAASRG
jgi:UDP-glucose 4-epimerase